MTYDVLTIGDAMVTFKPKTKGPMKYVDEFERKVGGAELNLAIGCARLGLRTAFISHLGNDEFGRHILNFIRGEGIDVSNVHLIDGYPTSVNFREILEDGTGRTFYYRDRSPTETMTWDSINEEVIKSAKVLHISGVFASLAEKNLDILIEMTKIAHEHGVKVCLDPNIRLKLWDLDSARTSLLQLLENVDYVFSTESEVQWLFGNLETAEYVAKFQEYGVELVVVTCGEEGAIGYYKDELIRSPSVPATKVVDTVGAGDGFNAGFLYAFLQGKSLEDSLHFGNVVGSMVVSVAGDNEGLPYLEDVIAYTNKDKQIER